MNIVDALFLDPSPFEIWISVRSDSLPGTGSLNDPFDGSTQAKFDARMGALAAGTTVHLGPGIFNTAGYNGTSGWQVAARVKLRGA